LEEAQVKSKRVNFLTNFFKNQKDILYDSEFFSSHSLLTWRCPSTTLDEQHASMSFHVIMSVIFYFV